MTRTFKIHVWLTSLFAVLLFTASKLPWYQHPWALTVSMFLTQKEETAALAQRNMGSFQSHTDADFH